MARKWEDRQYAVYLGKTRRFPKGEKVEHGGIYNIHVDPPRPDNVVWTVDVISSEWRLYIPYPGMRAIYEDWMPYGGELDED